MDRLSEQLRHILSEHGAQLIGFGDVSDIVQGELSRGVCVGLPMPKDMVRSIEKDVTQEYRQWYHDTNAQLDKAIKAGGEFLRSEGYETLESTTDKVVRTKDHRTALPHKSIAIRAGLGWIGRSSLLVTPEYGSALRLSSMITNAPLSVAEPILESRCGKCSKCRDVCPYEALTGKDWEKGIERGGLLDYEKCAQGAMARSLEVIGVDMTICGKCFVFCPYTRKYIKD